MGSLAFMAGAVIIAPIVINYVADKLSNTLPLISKDDDDWGPEIVRRTSTAKEDGNGEL